MKYYVYVPGLNQEAVTVYDSRDKADMVAEEFRRTNLEAWVCEFGFPFS